MALYFLLQTPNVDVSPNDPVNVLTLDQEALVALVTPHPNTQLSKTCIVRPCLLCPQAVDYWSLGVTVFKLLTGSRPFNRKKFQAFVDDTRCRMGLDYNKYNVSSTSPSPLLSVFASVYAVIFALFEFSPWTTSPGFPSVSGANRGLLINLVLAVPAVNIPWANSEGLQPRGANSEKGQASGRSVANILPRTLGLPYKKKVALTRLFAGVWL